MDFISGAIIGGLIYDGIKYGATNYIQIVKEVLTNPMLTHEDKLLIGEDLLNATEEDKSSKENLENYFETKAPNTSKIINKYKTQNNQTHSGIGDNNQNNSNGTFIKNQTVYNSFQKENIKKH